MNRIVEIFNQINIEDINLFIEQNIDTFNLTWGDKVYTTFNYNKNILKFLPNIEADIVDLIQFNVNCNTVEIFESWFSVTNFGGYQSYHIHYAKNNTTNVNIISGVYYIQTDSKDGNIVFDPEDNQILYNNFPISEGFSIIPEIGKVLLFPSDLRHKVSKNQTSHSRISLAFNCKIL